MSLSAGRAGGPGALRVGLLISAAALAGCIPSEPLPEGELDRLWFLTADPSRAAPLTQPAMGATKLPARWIVRQKPSVIVSTISVVRAYDRMKEGVEEIDFSISPVHTRTLISLMRDAREIIEDLGRLAETEGKANRKHWAGTLADTLVRIERITRQISVDEAAGAGDAEPLGLAAGPLLEIVAAYLNERSAGALLKDLGPDEIGRLRSVLTQMTLRLGFDLLGKQLPADLRQAATTVMRQAERVETLDAALREMLLAEAGRAPPARTEGETGKIFRRLTSWSPRGLKVLEALLAQWDRVDRVELEFRRLGDEPVLVTTVRVAPGKVVRVAGVMIGQPTMVFRGAARITVLPEAPRTGETVVTFAPVDGADGAVEMRFEGILYALAKLLAFPLADGALREVRVYTDTPATGRQMIHAAVLMEALAGKGDRRRMLVFQDARTKRLVREPFAVRTVEADAATVVNYLTSRRRYTYRRTAGRDE